MSKKQLGIIQHIFVHGYFNCILSAHLAGSPVMEFIQLYSLKSEDYYNHIILHS